MNYLYLCRRKKTIKTTIDNEEILYDFSGACCADDDCTYCTGD